MRVKLEEFNQAKRIHGGVASFCVASLGVRLSRVPIPSRRLRRRVFQTMYGQKYAALNESELEKPLDEFRSMNELFTRGVRAEFRPMPNDNRQFMAPCDSTVQDHGIVTDDLVLTAKSIPYSVSSLLASEDVGTLSGGQYAVLFLSPADCHRVFCPTDGVLTELTHVPGHRLLVHPPFQRKEFPVFTLNERVILRIQSERGQIVLVMVAGWGVGNITFPFGDGPTKRSAQVSRKELDRPIPLRRGDWMATFELGSTVIVLAEPAVCEEMNLQPGKTLQYGQPIAKLKDSEGDKE